MSTSLLLFVLALGVALSISFLCSLSEAVLLSLTPADVAELSQRHPKRGAAWKRFKDNIDRPISAILILNTSAHTIGATVAGAEFNALFSDSYLWVFSLVFTFAMLQYTEILPKTLGVRFNRNLAFWLLKPLSWAILFFTPIIILVRWINTPFESKRSNTSDERTLEDLILMTALARQTQKIGRQQEKMIVETAKLSEKTAGQIMIPMNAVRLLPITMRTVDILNPERHDSHTRYPVYDHGNPDEIIGYVNTKEIIAALRTDGEFDDLRSILREVHFVEPDEPITRLLLAFTSRREHLAVVRNESGRCLGMITLEDIMEEIVGELEDEFDHLPKWMYRDPEMEDRWLVGGGVTVGEFFSTVLCPLKEGIDPNRSLSDWLESLISEPARVGQSLPVDQVIFHVKRVRRGHITELSTEIFEDTA